MTAAPCDVDGVDPADVRRPGRASWSGWCRRPRADLLYLETVDDECAAADDRPGPRPGTCRELLDRLAPGIDGDRPSARPLGGQRLALVLAIVLTAAPAVVALDEPTRGLDYTGQGATSPRRARAGRRRARRCVVATHDVEFVATVADQVVVMAGGEVVSAGPTPQVLAESPAFAPQMSKILGPGWLTVDQVRAALA